MPSAWSGMNWIAGGAAAAILLPLLVIGVGMPFWIAGLISAAAGGGLVVLLSPRRLFEGSGRQRRRARQDRVCARAPDRCRAAGDPPRSRRAARSARRRSPSASVHLARISREIFAGIEEEPLRVDRVRRFLTYYLPRAADLAEAYALLEKSGNRDTKRLAATSDLIDRLDTAFTSLRDKSAGSRSRQSRHRAQAPEEFAR